MAISFMGNRAQADILRQLSLLGPSTVGQIQVVTEIGRPSLNRHLAALEATGLIATDPPPGHRHGKSVTYRVEPKRIAQLAEEYVRYVSGR